MPHQLYIEVLQALDKAAALVVSMDVPVGGGCMALN